MTTAMAKVTNARISLKHSLVLCKAIRKKNLNDAKNLLENLINKRSSLDGKYYTNASEKFLEVLQATEANAKQKNLNTEKLFVKIAKADKGNKFIRPKSRFKFRGREAKMTNIEIVLGER